MVIEKVKIQIKNPLFFNGEITLPIDGKVNIAEDGTVWVSKECSQVLLQSEDWIFIEKVEEEVTPPEVKKAPEKTPPVVPVTQTPEKKETGKKKKVIGQETSETVTPDTTEQTGTTETSEATETDESTPPGKSDAQLTQEAQVRKDLEETDLEGLLEIARAQYPEEEWLNFQPKKPLMVAYLFKKLTGDENA